MGLWTWDDTYSGNAEPLSLGSVGLNIRYSSAAQGSDEMVWQRNFQYQYQPINQPGALPIVFEGMSTPPTLTLQGLVLYEDQLNMLSDFYLLPRTTNLIDDRGWNRLIYPSQFQYTRTPSALYPWKGSFQLTALVFSISYTSDYMGPGKYTPSYGYWPSSPPVNNS